MDKLTAADIEQLRDLLNIKERDGGYATGGIITQFSPNSGAIWADPNYVVPGVNTHVNTNTRYHRSVQVTNAEGVTIDIQVDALTNTVKVDFDALMELLRLAGFEEGKKQ